MTWTKLSDDFADDVWTLSDEAFRLHVEGLGWSNRKLSDMSIRKDDLRRFAKHPEAVQELLDTGFWEESGPETYTIRHHASYQRTREQVIAQQARASANGSRGGRPKGSKTQQQSHPLTQNETHGESQLKTQQLLETQTETQQLSYGKTQGDGLKPVPSKNSSLSSDKLCELLADLIESNGSRRPTVTKAWRDSARLLLEKDSRDVGEIERLLKWCQGDDFWKSNILSMPKFRDKYDQLRLKAGAATEPPATSLWDMPPVEPSGLPSTPTGWGAWGQEVTS
ncbi:hypothetical protein J2T10_000758 [Paenarthrobacter nicotinovorans]|uniref:Uncharacterized protein n=1 Tax=Paenarthrobacter nicotinovorans TaxID=29320 RepID=A0ABT9THN9_PAENI|nr:hypothetical protein [Paenarthrobacter nicotinovorans]MDQ0101139.1 hypothetical protein [Paenarthrobacter nicotinovorans]